MLQRSTTGQASDARAPAHHEFLPKIAFELDPVIRTTEQYGVSTRLPMIPSSFILQADQQRGMILSKVIRVSEKGALHAFHQVNERCTPGVQRLPVDVLSINPWQMEDEQDDVSRAASVEGVLQRTEVGLSFWVEHNRFGVVRRNTDRDRRQRAPQT
ncbi:hypothetical protein CUJ88_48245 (plasmid) [Paraburkholderia hospita]|nr:hypothetical protein CUJ88_48245 [Paraburkholderia hospita]